VRFARVRGVRLCERCICESVCVSENACLRCVGVCAAFACEVVCEVCACAMCASVCERWCVSVGV